MNKKPLQNDKFRVMQENTSFLQYLKAIIQRKNSLPSFNVQYANKNLQGKQDRQFMWLICIYRHINLALQGFEYCEFLQQCPFPDCLKTFNQKGNLVVHIRIHTDEKPFKCTYCIKRFQSNGNQKDHERRHTDDKPYQCYICEKGYYRKYQLIKHQSTKHNQIEMEGEENKQPTNINQPHHNKPKKSSSDQELSLTNQLFKSPNDLSAHNSQDKEQAALILLPKEGINMAKKVQPKFFGSQLYTDKQAGGEQAKLACYTKTQTESNFLTENELPTNESQIQDTSMSQTFHSFSLANSLNQRCGYNLPQNIANFGQNFKNQVKYSHFMIQSPALQILPQLISEVNNNFEAPTINQTFQSCNSAIIKKDEEIKQSNNYAMQNLLLENQGICIDKQKQLYRDIENIINGQAFITFNFSQDLHQIEQRDANVAEHLNRFFGNQPQRTLPQVRHVFHQDTSFPQTLVMQQNYALECIPLLPKISILENLIKNSPAKYPIPSI